MQSEGDTVKILCESLSTFSKTTNMNNWPWEVHRSKKDKPKESIMDSLGIPVEETLTYDIKWVQAGDFELLLRYEIM